MTNRNERGGNEEKPISLLDATKAKLNTAIHNPLLPNVVPIVLLPMLARIIPLAPDDYIAVGMNIYGGKITPENEPSIRESANNSTAAYYDQYPADGKSAIIIKQAYLDSNPHIKEMLASLLAEELAHAFSKTRKVPLAKLKDQPTYIMPEETREKTLANVNAVLAERGDLASPATIEDITIKIRGFKSVFIDQRTGYYVIFGGSSVLEETRSAFVQTVLNILMEGRGHVPFKSPEKQFAEGHRSLESRTWYDSRSRGALQFLDIYLYDTRNLRQGLEKLLKALYNQDIDQFNLSLNPIQRTSFNEAVFATLEEHERRMRLRR